MAIRIYERVGGFSNLTLVNTLQISFEAYESLKASNKPLTLNGQLPKALHKMCASYFCINIFLRPLNSVESSKMYYLLYSLNI
jgi:hypothetical protein